MTEYLTYKEVASEMGVSITTVKRWIARGLLKRVLLSERGSARVERTEMDAFKARRRQESIGESQQHENHSIPGSDDPR